MCKWHVHVEISKESTKKQTNEQKNCTVKEIINEMKKQYVEWKKIFANHVSDRG